MTVSEIAKGNHGKRRAFPFPFRPKVFLMWSSLFRQWVRSCGSSVLQDPMLNCSWQDFTAKHVGQEQMRGQTKENASGFARNNHAV